MAQPKEKLRWRVFWKGAAWIFFAIMLATVALAKLYPESAENGAIGLLAGFVLYPLIGVWYVVWRLYIR